MPHTNVCYRQYLLTALIDKNSPGLFSNSKIIFMSITKNQKPKNTKESVVYVYVCVWILSTCSIFKTTVGRFKMQNVGNQVLILMYWEFA